MLTDILKIGTSIIDKLFPDKDKANEFKLKLLELEQKGELQILQGQVEINKIEAASESIFKSGWRPALGWCCSLGFLYEFLLRPILHAYFPFAIFPPLNGNELMSLTFGLLGLAGMRGFEKIKRIK